MNLAKLFDTQKVLDARIMENHPELVGQNNLDWKVLALQVELGECANEWRGFKKWSNDQESRTKLFTWIDGFGKVIKSLLDPRGLNNNAPNGFNAFRVKNPLLEEYVDCLHFILSIGLELKLDTEDWIFEGITYHSIITQFIALNEMVSELFRNPFATKFLEVVETFIGLGEMLEFEWEQVEQAYYEKNEINHNRQANGY